MKPEFILRESDGRAVVVGKIETPNLDKVREVYSLGIKVVQFQSIQTGEEFYRSSRRVAISICFFNQAPRC